MPKGTIEILVALLILYTALFNPKVSVMLAVAALILLGLQAWGNSKKFQETMNPVNEERHDEKEKNLGRAFALAEEKGSITNDEVERLLGVSDATAERYLDELEHSGKLEQVGRQGRSVSYRPKG